MISKDFPNLERYRQLIFLNLTDQHKFTDSVAQSLLNRYEDEILAMHQAGITAVVPARLLYAEYKVFSNEYDAGK